ncbi:hypothetical protein L226DRAFT_570685 [Lentinus tigrinus ALCF2SS1-7]|nr:hypothetical protein L226DRAFT_570685 [Lentinus tigrinus ALCF2SS1-7]
MDEAEPTSSNLHNSTRAARIMNVLTLTSAAYLTSPSPIPTTTQPPRYLPAAFSPQKRRYKELLAQTPTTPYEAQLQAALRESDSRDTARKATLVGMQATVLLQGVYVDRQMEKDGRRTKKRKTLSDGLPHLLTHNDFVSHVEQAERAQEDAKAQREARKVEREQYQRALVKWKKAEEERKARNKERKSKWPAEKEAWEAERKLACAEKREPRWEKPKLGLESPLQRPRMKAAVAEQDQEQEEEDDGEAIKTDDSDRED